MKKSLLTAILSFLLIDLLAQNTGIGTLNPQRTLHVGGGLRVDTLAGAGNGIIKFDNNGDLIRFPQSGNVLDVLRGDGTWGSPGGPWISDASGIHNQTGNVGVGGNSSSATRLDVQQQNTGGFSIAMLLRSADTWHTAFSIKNTSGTATQYTFSLGGSSNIEVGVNNLGIINHNTAKWAFIINGATDNIGIGMTKVQFVEQARSRLHVFSGDVNIDQIGSGIILKSPNGQCWRITIDNSGNLVRTAITCP